MTKSELRWLSTILVVIALTLRPHVDLTSGDFSFYLQTKSFAELRLDIPIPTGVQALPQDMALKDGRLYSHYPPGTALLLVPSYWLGDALDRITGGGLGVQTIGGWQVTRLSLLSVQLPSLFFLAAIFALLRRLSLFFAVSSSGYLLSVFLLVFAAPFWNQSNHVSSHLPSTLLSLAATVLALECRGEPSAKLALAGLAGGAAVLVRPAAVVVFGVLGLYVLATSRRRLGASAAFGMPATAGVLLFLFLNAAMFGAPFESGYQYDTRFGREGAQKPVLASIEGSFTMPLAQGLTGLVVGAISPEPPAPDQVRAVTLPSPRLPWDQVRGLVWVMPVILFAAPGLALFWRQGKPAEVLVLAGQFFALLLLYSKWSFWFANGHTPLASRFLGEVYPGLCLAVGAYAERAEGWGRRTLHFAASWSVANQVLLIASIYLHYFLGIDLVAAETYKVAVALGIVSGLTTWGLSLKHRNANPAAAG